MASTVQLGDLLRQAADVATHLDTAVQNKYARKPDTLAAWIHANRLERAPQRAKPAAAPTASPAAAN